MKMSEFDFAVAAARALGHPARLRIVAMLRSGELCVCQITEVLGLAPSTVSAHLKDLKQAGLIGERKDGRWVHIGLSPSSDRRRLIDASLAQLAHDPQLVEDSMFVEELRDLPVEDLCRLGYKKAKKRRQKNSKSTKSR